MKSGESLCCCAESTGIFQVYAERAGMGNRRLSKCLHEFALKEVINNIYVAVWFPLPGGAVFLGVCGATMAKEDEEIFPVGLRGAFKHTACYNLRAVIWRW